MASVVDLCNSALNLLGASTITALTDDSKISTGNVFGNAGRVCT